MITPGKNNQITKLLTPHPSLFSTISQRVKESEAIPP